MQQMLIKNKNDDSSSYRSDMDQFTMIMGGRFPFTFTPGNRDSGYGTDYSPASASSSLQQSTFSDSFDIFDGMDGLKLSEEAYPGSGETNKVVINNDVEDDDMDKEIEELLNENGEAPLTVSQPMSIQRPPAPIPTPEDYAISQPFHHTYWNKKDRHRYRFRPIVSHSVGSQTPRPFSQIILEARSVRAVYPNTHSSTRSKTRVQSESRDGENYSCLPDVIQFPRDRSVSLPDVPTYKCQQHEQEVGSELRRISDEFNSSFTRVQQIHNDEEEKEEDDDDAADDDDDVGVMDVIVGNTSRASSFPMSVNIDLYGCINGIRRILSNSPVFLASSPTEEQMNQRPFFDLSDLE